MVLFAGTAAFAKCGDMAGDFEAVDAVRADVKAACDCASATTHAAHVRCAQGVVMGAVSEGRLPRQCSGLTMRCARKSTCGRPAGFVPCCRTNRFGVTNCTIRKDVNRCKAPRGGSACASSFATNCCESCLQGGCIQPTPTPPRPTPTPITFCDSVIGLPALAQVPVTTQAGSADCGGPLFNPPPAPPLSGHVDDADGNKLADLAVGCLYTGLLPPTRLGSGSTAVLDVVGLGLPTVVLAGSNGSGPRDCTKGAGPLKHCLNGKPGTDGNGLCGTDADCNNQAGSCQLDGNCSFGAPVPVPGLVPACSVNTMLSDMCGSMNVLTFEVNFSLAIQARTYVGPANEPCPLCVDNVCSAGKNAGLACEPLGNYGTSPDCPPLDNKFIAAIDVVIPALTTGTTTMLPDGGGLFCDGQVEPGLFGLTTARSLTQTGTGVSQGGLSGETTAVATFCIPETGNALIDIVGGFPTAGTLAAKSSIDVTQILLP